MDSGGYAYHERFLHWVWGSLHFNTQNLRTACGKPVSIIEPGELNPTDGPDFKQARLQIGKLQWVGDVEIHWSSSGWFHHGHHTDPNYNRVVLHVVYDQPGKTAVTRRDGTNPFTLHLQPYLPENLDHLLAKFHRKDRLPCSGHLRHISQHAFVRQLEKAHREYFEKKADYLLEYYDPDLPPSLAWKRILVLGLFDGLGISLNREPMLGLGRALFKKWETVSSREQLVALAERSAGFENHSQHTGLHWNVKSCRPNNHPGLRVRQASELMWQILHNPFEEWLTKNPADLWSGLIKNIRTRPGIGTERSQILYGVVFLPSLYLLGNLLHSEGLKQQAFGHWISHKADIPQSLFRLYEKSGIPPDLYQKKLGAVFQLKHYCKPRRCQHCEVLKQVISS